MSTEKSHLRSLYLFDTLSGLLESVLVTKMPNMLSVMPLTVLPAGPLAPGFQLLHYFEEEKI